MKTKSYYDSSSDGFDHKEYSGNRGTLNKFDFDLFDEDKDVVESVVRVKRTQLPNKTDRWRVIQDTKTIFTVDGSKISKKEREFLKTADGFSFLVAKGKEGIKSLNSLRKALKLKLKSVS